MKVITLRLSTPIWPRWESRWLSRMSPSKGRIDLSIQLTDKIYIIEFKVDQPGRALAQIKDKGYHDKFLGSGKTIYLVDINFDSKEKNITDFAWEEIR